MKTITLFFFIVFAMTMTLNAQITKGIWLLGGSGEYSNLTYKFDNDTKSKIERVTIKPNVGYFIKEKFALGGALRFEHQDIFYTYGIGLFTRYYFLEPDKTFNLFAQVHYDYVYTVSDIDRASQNSTSHFYGVRAGQVVFFNRTVGLEVAIEYERGKLPNGISDNIKAVIGFQIHLEK
jgi:long-subunit fatty acid transport protein